MSENQNPNGEKDILADENLLGKSENPQDNPLESLGTETLMSSPEDSPVSKDTPVGENTTPAQSQEISTETLPWEDATANSTAPTSENTAENVVLNGRIIDININSLEDVVHRIVEKEYDYLLIEPEESEVKLSFRKENIERSAVYVKYPVYTTLLFQIKQTAGLLVENTKDPQEGKGNMSLDGKTYIIGAKTSPSQNGEKIWMKPKLTLSPEAQKAQKTPLSQILGFFAAIFFVALVLGGMFITFVILNTNDVSDVRFFSNLGIRLQDINDFLSGIVTFIFSLLLFLFTIILSVSLFRFFLTPKVLKKKKLTYGLFSAFMLIITFMTGVLWMTIDQKIKTFPNWGEGDLKIYDNTLKLSELGDEDIAIIENTQALIGPVSLLFDLSNFETNRKNQGYTIQKYIWDINGEVQETFVPTLIYDFDEKGNYTVNITAEMTDINNQSSSEKIGNIAPIAIASMIETDISKTNNGGLRASFNANDLKNQGKVVWYFKEPLTETNPNPSYPDWTEVYEGYEFIARQIFFDTTYVGIDIVGSDQESESIEKVIAINPNANSEISGEIAYNKSLSEDLEVEFFVKNPKTSFGNGFIEEFIWNIEDKSYSVKNTDLETTVSPSVKHLFSKYGEHKISVTLIDSKGSSETLDGTILLQKNVEIQNNLLISDKDDQAIENYRYEKRSNEYFIDGLGVPATIKLDARMIRPVNTLYSLKEVLWDGKNDGNIDGKEKMYTFEIPTEGNHVVAVTYNFVHRKDPSTVISLKEFIYIEGIKQDAILSLKMEYESNYAPVNVRFDASESFIKDDNIIKFIYDYGDGITEERDAINPSHLYSKPGDYTVTLTVVGKTGKTYSTQRKLILLPPPQGVKISTSMKKAPINQGIDFSSSESSGQIIEYFWNFGDGNTSTEANPTHSYKKPGVYKVTLKVNFDNKNSISDEIEIEIQ